MQSTVLGVRRMQGVGKTSKNAYDMASVLVMSPIKAFAKEGLNIAGHGFEVAEVALKPECLDLFAGMKFPVTLDLETDMEPRGGKLTPIVTGIKPAKAVA